MKRFLVSNNKQNCIVTDISDNSGHAWKSRLLITDNIVSLEYQYKLK